MHRTTSQALPPHISVVITSKDEIINSKVEIINGKKEVIQAK